MEFSFAIFHENLSKISKQGKLKLSFESPLQGVGFSLKEMTNIFLQEQSQSQDLKQSKDLYLRQKFFLKKININSFMFIWGQVERGWEKGKRIGEEGRGAKYMVMKRGKKVSKNIKIKLAFEISKKNYTKHKG